MDRLECGESHLKQNKVLVNAFFNTVYALEGTPLWRWTFERISRASRHTAKPGGIASIDLQTILQYLTLCVTTVMRP